MSDLNKVILIGRLTKDPELRKTKTDTSVASFTLAVNRTYKANGEKKEDVSFFTCIAWSKTAEVIAEYVKKGYRFGVEGRLQQRSWEDDKGNKRSTVEVIVDNFQFLENGKKDGVESIGVVVDNDPFSDENLPF